MVYVVLKKESKMPSNLLFNNENVVFDNYDSASKTLTIKDVNEETYYLTFDNYVPETLTINVINSKVSIIENYKGNLTPCNFIIFFFYKITCFYFKGTYAMPYSL